MREVGAAARGRLTACAKGAMMRIGFITPLAAKDLNGLDLGFVQNPS